MRATGLALMLVVSGLLAGPATTADNGAGEADGLVVVVGPRSATAADGKVLMSPLNGLYIFDLTTYTDTGAPFRFTEYNVEVHSIDPATNGAGSTVYIEDIQTAPTHRDTVRIPASALAWGAAVPSDGIVFTIALRYDAEGRGLHDAEWHLPGGAYNVATKTLVAEGRYDAADAADETFTPLFLLDLQPDGLVRLGNPILNPGFEVSASDGAATDTVATPPWLFFADAGGEGPGGVDGQTPWSDTERVPSAGRSGHALRVHYDPRDAPRNVIFGQSFGSPDLPGMWYGTVGTKLRIDWRVSDPSGLMTSHVGLVGLYIVGPGGQERIGRAVTIPADGEWRTATYDYSAVAGKPLTSLWLSFNISAPPGSALQVDIDDVRLSGVVYQTTEPRNDLNDGHSAFIFPRGAQLGEGAAVVQHLTALGDGTRAYVYALSAMDYTAMAPREVDLAATDVVTFQLLDDTFVASGASHDAEDTVASIDDLGQSARFLRTRAADGSLEPGYLVVLHESLLDAPGATGTAGLVTPWMHADLGAMAPDYVDTFGSVADPVSGFHSVLRNALMPFSVSDQLDQAATPVQLSGVVGDNVDATPTVTLLCPGVPGGAPCWAGPGHPATVLVEVEGASHVLETASLGLRSPDTTVLRTTTVSTEGSSTPWTLGSAEIEALSDRRLVAEQGAAWFSRGATSAVLRLDNLLPTAAFDMALPPLVKKGAVVGFTDRSSDADGTIVDCDWEVHLLNDPSPDGDSDTPGLVSVGSGPTFSFVVPDDGVYEARLQVTDNEGGVQRANATFVAVNVRPHATFEAQSFQRPGLPVTFRDHSADGDGVIVQAEWDLDGDGTFETVGPGTTFSRIFSAEATLSIGLRVTDDDGATDLLRRTLIIDGTAPITVVNAFEPAIDGWYSQPIDMVVRRTDAPGAGIRLTRVYLDAVLVAARSGPEDFAFRISGEGSHVVEYQSEDMAGNLEFASGTLLKSVTIRIDDTPPVVQIVAPRVLGPIGDAYFQGDSVEVEVSAEDALSGVSFVALMVDGRPVDVDEDGSDGWGHVWRTDDAALGVHILQVVGVDVAGNIALSDEVAVVLIPSPF